MNRSLIISLPVFIIGWLFFSACGDFQPNETPEDFSIHPDFQLELAASEPLVFDPVDMEFDENGHAYVLEMPGYPLSDEHSRLVLLNDQNQDGIYDERIVFADSLNVASSFMPYKKGMLVASPPHLLFLQDTDGDQIADYREIILDGFDLGNLQHNYNGLTYGLDNWIYVATGGNSGAPYFVDRPENKLPIRDSDLRFDLEKKIIERVGETSGGFELAFDSWGRMYSTNNTQHIFQVVFHANYVEGIPLESGSTLTNISDHEENGLARVYPVGEQDTRVNHPEQSGYFSGACGITYYGGGTFPEEYNDHIFVADVVLNLIHLDKLGHDNIAAVASRDKPKQEFLASADRAFRPVNMTTGPDGSLYVLDMHRDVIEHPEWIPDELEAKMDLNAGKDKGRIYRISPNGTYFTGVPVLASKSLEDLVASLGDKNQWVRMTAQRILVERNDATAIPILENLAIQGGTALARLHAMRTLEGMNQLSDQTLIEMFAANDPLLQKHAIQVAEKRLDQKEIIEQIIPFLETSFLPLKAQTLLALGQMPDELYPQYQMHIFREVGKWAQQDQTDIWLNMAASSALAKAPLAFLTYFIEEHQQGFNQAETALALTMTRLLAQNQNYHDLVTLLEKLPSWEQNNEAAKLILAMAEASVKDHLPGKDKADFEQALASLETNYDVTLIKATGNLRNQLGLTMSAPVKRLMRKASKEVMHPSQSTEKRLEWLQLMALDQFDRRAVFLYKLLDNREPLALQKEALWQLWKANDPTVGKKLIQLWPNLGPEARKQAGNILIYNEANHDLLLTALETGAVNMGELNLDLERRRSLLFSDNEEIKNRAEALFTDAGVIQRKEAMLNMRPALELAGNRTHGEEVFTVNCSSCHQYDHIGKNVGPVLTEISRKSRESLLHDILDPNAAVDTRYVNHQLKTKEGKIYLGLVSRETDTEITIKSMGGGETTVNKKEIESLSSQGISMMPEGLEENLSVEDMADLLAFLQSK